MSNSDRISEIRFIVNDLESAVDYHREEARKHTAIADALFGLSNKFDRRQSELENIDKRVVTE